MVNVRTGLIGGAVGLVATTAAVAVAVDRAAAARRRAEESGGTEKFADLPVDRSGVIVAEDGAGLYYEEVGPLAAPLTVVFVHGFALNLRSFFFQRRAITDELGERVRMVFYDQRAHGRSDRSSAERASIDQLGRDLGVMLSTVAPYGPIVLVGHSMGGMTILALADQQPELFTRRVRGVALMSTSTGKLAAVTLGLPALLARAKGPTAATCVAHRAQSPGPGRTRSSARGRRRLGDHPQAQFRDGRHRSGHRQLRHLDDCRYSHRGDRGLLPGADGA